MMGFNEYHFFDHNDLPLLGVELKYEGYETEKKRTQIFLRLTHATEQPGRERWRSSSWDL